MAAKKFHALPRRRQIDKLMIVKTRTKSSKAKKEEQRERVWAWLAKQTDLWEINLYDIILKTISPTFRQSVQDVKGF